MATTFTYYKSIDFPHDQVSLTVLKSEIYNADYVLYNKLKRLDSSGDAVAINFYSDLSGGEVTELNNIVANHGGTENEQQTIAGYDTTMLTTLIDESGQYTYVGEASPGTTTDSPLWRIFRLDETGTGSIELIKVYANNTAYFDKIWDNRESYLYSL